MDEQNNAEQVLNAQEVQNPTEQTSTERACANPDMVQAEYSYDLPQFRRMFMRVTRKTYIISITVAIGFLAVIFGGMVVLSDELILQIGAAVMFVALATAMGLSMRKGARIQAEKNFAMYSKNGIAHERIEIAGNSLYVTDFGTDSHLQLDRTSIAGVQNYGDFFVIKLSVGTNKFVPLTEQTRPLYNALTDSDVFDRAAAANPSSEPVQPTERPADALSFTYELTREQSDYIMRSYGKSKTASSCGLGCVCLAVAALMTALAVIAEGAKNTFAFAAIAAILLAIGILLIVLYAVGLKNSARNGANYFDVNSRDGKMVQRIELSEQGIVAVNVLRDNRTNFRLADMARLRRGKDYFVVEFAANLVLPLPLNDETAQLYDLLAKLLPASGAKR